MSDLPTPTDQPTEGEPGGPTIPELREAAERGQKAQAERDQAVRELAFVKAGIDTDSGVGKLLFEGYKGEPTKEAVLEAAASYGISPTPATADDPPPAPGPEFTPDEQEQSRKRAALAAGSETPGGTPDADPYEAGFAAFNERLASGERREDAAAGFIDAVFGAAANGDKRVIFDQGEWMERARAEKG